MNANERGNSALLALVVGISSGCLLATLGGGTGVFIVVGGCLVAGPIVAIVHRAVGGRESGPSTAQWLWCAESIGLSTMWVMANNDRELALGAGLGALSIVYISAFAFGVLILWRCFRYLAARRDLDYLELLSAAIVLSANIYLLLEYARLSPMARAP